MIGWIFGGVCLCVAFWFYYHLWKYARLCQHTRVAIEFKGKVKTDQPIAEWLIWGHMLDKDKTRNGQVIYHQAGTRIAILRSWKGNRTRVRDMIKEWMPKQKVKVTPKKGMVKGQDQTPQENKNVRTIAQ